MRRMAAFVLALGLAAAPAAAQDAQKLRPTPIPRGVVSLLSADQVASILANRGYPAEINREARPARIVTTLSGRRVVISFYNCDQRARCQSIQYQAFFRKSDKFTLAFSNAWNLEKRFAKTYIDADGDMVLEWDVDFDGGVTAGYVGESARTFETLIKAFDEFTPKQGGPSERRA